MTYKRNNWANRKKENFYIYQFIKGNISEKTLFTLLPKNKAAEIIEAVKLGMNGAKKTTEMLSDL